MDEQQYIEAIEEMPIDIVKDNFEALFALALSIEDQEQQEVVIA
jgi:hypothetical protein